MEEVEKLTDKEIKQAIRTTDYNVRRRLARVAKTETGYFMGQNVKKYANERYEKDKISSRIKNLNNINREGLIKLYKDITEINALKSSSVKGYKGMYVTGARGVNEYHLKKALSKESADKFNEILETVKNRYGGLYEYMKYEIMNIALDETVGGRIDYDRIIENIDEAYEKMRAESGDTYDPDRFTELYYEESSTPQWSFWDISSD